MIVLPVVDSTNNYAMGQARAGLAGHGTAYLALEQTGGKGQRGKQWDAPAGENMLLSVVLDARTLELKQPFLLSVVVALACHDFFSRYTAPGMTHIKWPNDLYWQDRKAGGVLIENSYTAGSPGNDGSSLPATWKWAIAGIGININQTRFPDYLPNPVSLRQITGKTYDLMGLARELCDCLQLRLGELHAQTPATLMEAYNQRLYKLHETVRLKKDQEVFRTCIQGVDETGRLHTRDESDRSFGFGEAEWLKD